MRAKKVHHNDGARLLCNPGRRRGCWSVEISSSRGFKKVTSRELLKDSRETGGQGVKL